jgi:hypothetical protein
MPFTRNNPSPRYTALISAYRSMHTNGEQFLGIPPEKTFPGQSLLPQVDRIKEHVVRTGAGSLLDYGAGKGQQYLPMSVRHACGTEWPSIQAYWGVESVTCYDPSYAPFSQLPTGQFDGVICTDVLEHCPEEDMPWILDELFRYSRRFVFANVACYPAKKRLPSGENAHCTIRPRAWWEALLVQVSECYPQVEWEVWVQSLQGDGVDARLVEERLVRRVSVAA